MALNATVTSRLAAVAQAAAAAGPGGKGAIYAAACAELGISTATLHRHLAKVAMKPTRKQRSDAGSVSLQLDEATAIAALLVTSQRKNHKRLLSIGQAVDILRANGEIRAEFTCTVTGELRPLSDSAITRGLRHHGMHPDQLSRPTPAVELKSLHPNHVWQIDASMCVLYYLHAESEREAGLQVMERERFYKNKPANLKSIEQERVWSYEATDHTSGGLLLNYVMGAESGTNLADSFIEFIQPRSVIHGVPLILMMDMGSANTSGLFKNLARRLGVKLIAHAPGNARATGQVEKARDIIERSFEPALRLMPVADLADLNTQARRWADWFNAHKVHSRHGRTRADAWMSITAEQLRLAPSPELCRELLTHEPESRVVSETLTVQFKGREFDVRGVPGVMVGEKVPVTHSPYAPDTASIVSVDTDGNELLHAVPLVQRDENGFRADANVIGEDYRRPADTQLDTNRKAVERFAYDADTNAEAEARKKAKAVPFGGRIDPYKPIDQAPERTFLPRRGTALQPAVVTQAAPARVLTLFEAAAELARRGVALSPERHSQIRAWHSDGVPEDQLDALADRLQARAQLRVVAGGGA